MTARTRTIFTNVAILTVVFTVFSGTAMAIPTPRADFASAFPTTAQTPISTEETFFMPETSELDPEPVLESTVTAQTQTSLKSSYPEGVEPGIRALLPAEEQAQDLTPVLEADNTTTTSNYGASSVTYTIGSPMFFSGSAMNSPGSPSVDAFGHGLGFSQWGAYGAAKNANMTAEQIVTHYFKDTHLETRSPINVNPVKRAANDWNVILYDYGVMSIEDYLAGLAEVPSKACGDASQVAANPAKYALDDGSGWSCWPEAAIEAQIITARAFAATYAGQICDDHRCQVYAGGNAKAWAVQETANQYIVSHGYTGNGQVIRALFSSYNSNGWGTADHAIATNYWTTGNYTGTTSSYSYLRSVPDASFTHVHIGRSATVNSTAYRIDELDAMIDWCSTTCQAGAWLQTNVNSRIGTLTSLEFTSDDSGRVMLVRYIGTGGTATTSGSFFRSVYNTWVDVVRPHGVADKIPSISFKATATFVPTAEQLPAVNAAKADVLARNPGADPNVIFPQALSASEYGCLGTQATGFCATATTPGYKLIMSYANQAWEYRVRDDYSGLVFVGVTSQ